MWWVASGLIGCTSPPSDDPDDTDPVENGTVEIGTGRDLWEPVSDGDSLVMEHGPQGGWHITGALKAEGLDALVVIDFTITDLASGVVLTDYTYNVLMLTHDEGWHYYPGMIGFLTVDALVEGEADTPPELLTGNELELRMLATDPDGRQGSDSVTIIAARDPIDE